MSPSAITGLKVMGGSADPSPDLSATLSPSEGKRDGVRGFHAFSVFCILLAVRSPPSSPVLFGSQFRSKKAWGLALRRGPKSCPKVVRLSQILAVEARGQRRPCRFRGASQLQTQGFWVGNRSAVPAIHMQHFQNQGFEAFTPERASFDKLPSL